MIFAMLTQRLRLARFDTVRNGLYAIADYAAPQVALLLAAPYLLRRMGVAQVGVWMLASAAVTSGSLLSSGFGDAAVKYVAMYRGRGDHLGIARIVRGMLAINLALGTVLGTLFWVLAPLAVRHVAHIDAGLQQASMNSLRIGGILLAVRSLDSVFVSTLRALERYNVATRIAVSARLCALASTVALAAAGHGVEAVMIATLVVATAAAVAQAIAVRLQVRQLRLLPSLHRETLRLIAGFGCFSWLQAVSAVAFSQIDRLTIGVFLGAPAVAYYSICTQAAQPIHALIGAGFHALFPHLSSRFEVLSSAEMRATIKAAFKVNLAMAIVLALPVMLLSKAILAFWMGSGFAHEAWPVLTVLAASFGLLAVNVTAHYALLALGQVRVVTYLNLAAGAAMLVAMIWLTPRFGMKGTAFARLLYGPVTWAMYIPLFRAPQQTSPATGPRLRPLEEVA